MKKIWTTIIVIGMLVMGLSSVVSADSEIDDSSDDENEESIEEKSVSYGKIKRKKPSNLEGVLKAKFIGKWGLLGENGTSGYVAGLLSKKGRFGILKGIWNTTDNSSKGKVAGILRKGFFAGKVSYNGSAQRIVALYKVDKENYTFQMKWMTARQVGWAHCRIKQK